MKSKLILAVVLSVVVSFFTMNISNIWAITTYYDVNGDGYLNSSDSVGIIQYLNGRVRFSNVDTLDFNQNNVVTKVDADTILNTWLSSQTNYTIQTNPFSSCFSNEDLNYFVYNAQTGVRQVYDGYYFLNDPNHSNDGIAPASLDVWDDNNVVDWTKDGVVKVSTSHGYGTGFVIAPHVIATAAHVVMDNTSQSQNVNCYRNVKVELYDYSSGNSVPNSRIVNGVEIHLPYLYTVTGGRSNPYDYALISVSEDLSDYMQFDIGVALDGASYSGNNQLSVYATGFPNIYNPNKCTSTGHLIECDFDNERQIESTCHIYSGNSGGPLYCIENYNGNTIYSVVGILSASTVHSGVYTRMSTELIHFYKNNSNIHW